MKKLTIIISILLISILAIIIILLKTSSIYKQNVDIDETIKTTEDEIVKHKAISAIEMNRVKNCIYQYLNTVNINSSAYYGRDDNNNYVKIVSDNEIKEKVYKLLSKKYIQENNITKSNLFSYIDEIAQKVLFDIVDMKYYENTNSNQYVVYGITQSLDNNFINDVYYIVNINKENNVFSIEPLLNNELGIEEIKVEDTQIDDNGDNVLSKIANMTQDDICEEYFNTYKRILLAKPELAYEYLDEQYRKIKFANVENFKNYIDANRSELKGIRLNKYEINRKKDYRQYTLVDQHNNYYIINETEFMKYTVMLDNYTIGNTSVVEKYNSSTDVDKAKLDITKFFIAINNEDYIYTYNRLDETYRNNNFSTQEKFEKYIQENFYKNNEINCKKISQEGDLYVFEIVITNADNKTESINKTFIIKVLEEFDFVLSFNKE